MLEFRKNYTHDADGVLDGFVLSVHGFDESDAGNLHVCKENYRSVLSKNIPEAALANAFWVGK